MVLGTKLDMAIQSDLYLKLEFITMIFVALIITCPYLASLAKVARLSYAVHLIPAWVSYLHQRVSAGVKMRLHVLGYAASHGLSL